MAKETLRQFKARVFQMTGKRWSDLPWGKPEDAVLHKVCRRGKLYVVASGYPDRDDDGNETFTEFLRVRL